MTMPVLGLDTSNYTTSAAVFDGADGCNAGRLLAVRPGELGLRQSDALFQHVKQLPALLEELEGRGLLRDLKAVGASTRPRAVEGSYMPCFLVGKTTAELLGKAVSAIADGTAPRIPQDERQYTYAPMLSRDMSPIDWSRPALDIHNQIRGLVPWPATTMELAGTKFKVFAAFLTGETSDQPAGTALGADKKGIRMVCGDGQILCVTEVQAPGKKRMKAVDYLRGHPIF